MQYRKWRLNNLLWFGGSAVLFGVWSVVRCVTTPIAGDVFTGAAVVAALCALAFGAVLVVPQSRTLRIAVVVLPPVLFGLRMIALVLDSPTHWPGLVFAVMLAFAYTVAGPMMMPPPMSNGHVKNVLGGDRG